eukprot:GHUV01040456.1.p1 GENE.GHUV01040456.1~~GHUV01040456.1.p1  ORF type:complete len:180 (+),score=22.82 GHUV01040456.1:335-874(+)
MVPSGQHGPRPAVKGRNQATLLALTLFVPPAVASMDSRKWVRQVLLNKRSLHRHARPNLHREIPPPDLHWETLQTDTVTLWLLTYIHQLPLRYSICDKLIGIMQTDCCRTLTVNGTWLSAMAASEALAVVSQTYVGTPRSSRCQMAPPSSSKQPICADTRKPAKNLWFFLAMQLPTIPQ